MVARRTSVTCWPTWASPLMTVAMRCWQASRPLKKASSGLYMLISNCLCQIEVFRAAQTIIIIIIYDGTTYRDVDGSGHGTGVECPMGKYPRYPYDGQRTEEGDGVTQRQHGEGSWKKR